MCFYILGEFCKFFNMSVDVLYKPEHDCVVITLTRNEKDIDPYYKKYIKSIPMLMIKKIDEYDILRSFVSEMGLSWTKWHLFINNAKEELGDGSTEKENN